MPKIILLIIVSMPLVALPPTDRFTPCLPAGVTLKSEVVDYTSLLRLTDVPESSDSRRRPRTVKSILSELKAQCKSGTLKDGEGKEIRIVQLIGCWGNPPEDYQEQMDRQRREIEALRQKYIVLEIPCTPTKTIASASCPICFSLS